MPLLAWMVADCPAPEGKLITIAKLPEFMSMYCKLEEVAVIRALSLRVMVGLIICSHQDEGTVTELLVANMIEPPADAD